MGYILLFIVHLVGSYAIGCWFSDKLTQQTGETRFWKWFVISISLFIPVYGPLGCLIIYFLLVGKIDSTKASSKIIFEKHLQHVRIHKAVSMQLTEHNWKEIKEIQPIIEILKGNDIELQKDAIDTLSANGDIHSIKLLKDALGYANPEVRYFIVEALNKICKLYYNQIYIAKLALDLYPRSTDNILKLAECYFELAYSEVEDYSLNRFFYEQAYFYFSKALKYTKLKNSEKKKYGITLRQLGKRNEAAKILNSLRPSQMIKRDEMPELMEMFFQAGNYSGLSEIAQQYRDSDISTSNELEKSLSLWV